MDFGTFRLNGFSLGGVETCVWIPEWSLAIDVGRGPRELVRMNHLALTHTHMDHAAGLPYLMALRQLYGMAPPTVYVPAQMADGLVALIEAFDRVQRYQSRYHLIAAQPGERYPLKQGLELVPFRTYHTLPSLGYTVERTVDKLKPEYAGTPGPEIGRLRKQGVAVTEAHVTPLLSVTGDTLPEVLDRQPAICDSEVLVLECTFLDARKRYEDVRAGGHVHLDDLATRAARFRNRTLVLSHFSQIHRPDEVRSLLAPFADAIAPELRAFPMEPGQPDLGPIPRRGGVE